METIEPPFLLNKYTLAYYRIVENARRRLAVPDYVERHHIIPKSIGGNNEANNIVILTAREHFVCHRLLVKMTQDTSRQKMAYALLCMMQQKNQFQNRYTVSSHTYEILRVQCRSILHGIQDGKRNPFWGQRHTDKTKADMSRKRLERITSGVIEGMTGRTHSNETREKLREANRLQFLDPIQKEIRRTKNRNRLDSDPTYRTTLSEMSKGKVWYHDPLSGSNTRCFPDTQPSGFVRGRFKRKE